MNIITKSLLVAGLTAMLASCATIVSKSKYPVSIDSTPRGANIAITDRDGIQIFSGVTPSIIKLKPSAGFFRRANYVVSISKPGFKDKKFVLTATLNGWYFGNILFGGFIGLIVDPATGAVYRLNTTMVNETLEPKSTAVTTASLRIYDINEVPDAWKKKMECIE